MNNLSNSIKKFAKKIYQEKDMFFLGRGNDYNTALESIPGQGFLY